LCSKTLKHICQRCISIQTHRTRHYATRLRFIQLLCTSSLAYCITNSSA